MFKIWACESRMLLTKYHWYIYIIYIYIYIHIYIIYIMYYKFISITDDEKLPIHRPSTGLDEPLLCPGEHCNFDACNRCLKEVKPSAGAPCHWGSPRHDLWRDDTSMIIFSKLHAMTWVGFLFVEPSAMGHYPAMSSLEVDCQTASQPKLGVASWNRNFGYVWCVGIDIWVVNSGTLGMSHQPGRKLEDQRKGPQLWSQVVLEIQWAPEFTNDEADMDDMPSGDVYGKEPHQSESLHQMQ